jgi:micrococcal nuclease
MEVLDMMDRSIRQYARLLIVACFTFTALGFYSASNGTSADLPSYPQVEFSSFKPCPVVRVVDGDTVIVNLEGKDERVRLIGVDTPETVHPSRPVEEYGREASLFTKNLLTGEQVYLVYDKGSLSRDRYDRILAYLFRAPDGLFVNLEIVRQGYGHAYTRYPFKYLDLFRAYEKHARESGKGLWQPEAGK